MSSVVFGRAHVSEELECGFIPSEIIESLQADDSSRHIEAAQGLLSITNQTPISAIDIKSFLIFSAQFFLDDNFSVINCFNEMIEICLTQTDQSLINFLEEFLTMIITPLSDDRRAVRILIVNLMLLYVDKTKSLDLLRALLPLFPDQPILAKVEMLDFATQAIQRFTPTNQVYDAMADSIKEALSIQNSMSIQNAASRLINQVCSINPNFHKLLPKSALTLLSNEDQDKFKKAAAVKQPAPPSLALLVKTPIIPKPQLNPRGRNLLVRPQVNKNATSRSHAHQRQVQLPNLPSATSTSAPQFQVRPPPSDDSTNPIDELRERYQSQPQVHPPSEPGHRSNHSGQSSRAPRLSFRRSQEITPIESKPDDSKPNLSEIDTILNGLQDENWEIQNDTIISLIEIMQTRPMFISQNLRSLVFALMTSVSSLRSALAETALTCLRDLSSEFGEDMTSFFETVLNHLLTILSSKRPAIARLAADCISAILVNIDRDAALKYLGKDLSQKSMLIKEHLSLCIDALCGDCNDPSELIDSIGTLLMDENENTREHAKAAIAQLKQKFDNLKDLEILKSISPPKREIIIDAIENAKPLPDPVL